jgi:PIN domain nuclease of toxin-antitoxin system
MTALGNADNLVFVSGINTRKSFQYLDRTTEHALKVEQLPLHHRDPFDRLLVAQSLVDVLT